MSATAATASSTVLFGEDADKVDQYVTVDPKFARLRGGEGIPHAPTAMKQQKHPGNVYYL